jgi:hypothetical protein
LERKIAIGATRQKQKEHAHQKDSHCSNFLQVPQEIPGHLLMHQRCFSQGFSWFC